MDKLHSYSLQIEWTGNKGDGTRNYRGYERAHTIRVEGKPEIAASSDPSFRGDKLKYNPEELLVASVSSCHMLWYLHLCSEAGVVVTDYVDNAVGEMTETANGSGFFKQVILKPIVTVADSSMVAKANELHHKANEYCFVANSVKFPVKHEPTCLVKGE